jgi:multidrug resistance efflux pump
MEETRIRVDVPRATRISTAKDSVPRASTPAVSNENRRKWRGRVIRWIIGTAMLAEAGWLVVPVLLFRASVRATITAPVRAIRVHHEGVVKGTPPFVGAAVTAGQELFEVQTATLDPRPLDRIRGEIESTRRTANALRAQIAALDELKATLNKHFSDYRDARIAQAEKQAAEQAARVSAAAARLKTAEFDDRLQRRLSIRGVSCNADRAHAENALAEARNELEVAKHASDRLQLHLEAARKGIFVGEADGGQDRVASRQRCDEIEIQQLGLRARLAELDGQLCELDARLVSEERYLAGNRLSIVAPISGIVWTSTLTAGSNVSPGATVLEIVDTERLGIEAQFKDADAARVRAGCPVKVRLLGSSRILSGRVVRVAAPGTIEQDVVGIAARESAIPGTFRTIIALDEQPAGDDSDSLNDVGATAIVWTTR